MKFEQTIRDTHLSVCSEEGFMLASLLLMTW